MEVTYQLRELLLENGDSPFAKWYGGLDPLAAAKVRVALTRLAQCNLSNVVSKVING